MSGEKPQTAADDGTTPVGTEVEIQGLQNSMVCVFFLLFLLFLFLLLFLVLPPSVMHSTHLQRMWAFVLPGFQMPETREPLGSDLQELNGARGVISSSPGLSVVRDAFYSGPHYGKFERVATNLNGTTCCGCHCKPANTCVGTVPAPCFPCGKTSCSGAHWSCCGHSSNSSTNCRAHPEPLTDKAAAKQAAQAAAAAQQDPSTASMMVPKVAVLAGGAGLKAAGSMMLYGVMISSPSPRQGQIVKVSPGNLLALKPPPASPGHFCPGGSSSSSSAAPRGKSLGRVVALRSVVIPIAAC